jgi:hypothetical protein
MGPIALCIAAQFERRVEQNGLIRNTRGSSRGCGTDMIFYRGAHLVPAATHHVILSQTPA